MKKIDNVTIGSDPEMFIISGSTGKVISSVGMIPGYKGDPWLDEEWKKPEMRGFGLETDNILAEFNIPPVTKKEDFIKNLEYMKSYVRGFVKKINPDYDILCAASMLVDEDQLQTDQAKEFGCSEDFNAYTEDVNPKPEGATTNLRSAGFHIHVGYNDPDIPSSLQMIKYMDQYLGLPSIVVDQDSRRRSLYGKAGCFRICPYGYEFRVLSAAMYSNPVRIGVVWDCIDRAIRAYNNEAELISPDLIQEAINTSNVQMAMDLIEKYNLLTY
jgi:hypothetical protein